MRESQMSKDQQQRIPWGKHVESLPGFDDAWLAAEEHRNRFDPEDRNRSFVKAMCRTSVESGWVVAFPMDFSKRYNMPQPRSEATLLDEKGRTWPVKWVWSPGFMNPAINAGWKPFSVCHGLERGDVCLFQLYDERALVFKVFIYKRRALGVFRRIKRERDHRPEPSPLPLVTYNAATAGIAPDSEDDGDDRAEDRGGAARARHGGAGAEHCAIARAVAFENEEYGETEIGLSVKRAKPSHSPETMSVELNLSAAKMERVQRLVVGSSSSVILPARGCFSARIETAELLAMVMREIFPLEEDPQQL